jgi:hypothetical protein
LLFGDEVLQVRRLLHCMSGRGAFHWAWWGRRETALQVAQRQGLFPSSLLISNPPPTSLRPPSQNPVLGGLATAAMARWAPGLDPRDALLPITKLPGTGGLPIPAPIPFPNLQRCARAAVAPCGRRRRGGWGVGGSGGQRGCPPLRPFPPLPSRKPTPAPFPCFRRPLPPPPPPPPNRLYFRILDPIDTAALGVDPKDTAAWQELYDTIREDGEGAGGEGGVRWV